MRVGIGLPSGIPGTDGATVLDWARRGEAAGFASLGVIERPAYGALDPLATLAAAAAVTERATLVTMVVIAPLWNPVLLAEAAATVDSLSGGRLVLGLGLGARTDDYDAIGVPHAGRGERFDELLQVLRERWEDGPGPRPVKPEGPPVVVGGLADVAFARMARHADGFVHNGGPPRAFARAAERARAAWRDAGRPGTPPLWGQSYFALGDEATLERGRAYMRDYYAFTGSFAEKIVEGMLSTPQALAAQLKGYEEAGCDDLVLLPAVPDPDQVDRLADALPGR